MSLSAVWHVKSWLTDARIVVRLAVGFLLIGSAASLPLFHCSEPPPQVKFVDITASSGLSFWHHNSATSNKYLIETMTGGLGVLDYDNDGWLDVFCVNGARLKDSQPDGEPLDKSAPEFWNRLYRNNRDGTFTDVTERAGLKGRGYGMGVAVADYDNDGFSDLLVTNYGDSTLYHNNGNGTFTDVTAKAGLKTEGWCTGAGFFDYDNDGLLDLFVCRYLQWNFTSGSQFCGVSQPRGRAYCHPDKFQPVSNYLFKNNGDGTFTDVSAPSHISRKPGKALGVAFADFNRDGFLDISVANDSFPQALFQNNGDGTFSEVGELAGVGYTEEGKTFAGMGTDFADVDNDGNPDIVTTALPYEYFSFFHNNGNGSFTYATLTSNLGKITRLFSGWGMRLFDYDNDGHKDLFVANSHVMDNIEVTQPHLTYAQKPLLLRNVGNAFVNVSPASGAVFEQSWASRGAAFGDLDNDGDMDIVVATCNGPAHILRNDGGSRNHWIALQLEGTQSNRMGIGARVTLTTASQTQVAMASTAASYLSASDSRVFFGIGKQNSIQEIRIRWPGGIEQVIGHPKPDQFLRVKEEGSRTGGAAVSQASDSPSKISSSPNQRGSTRASGTSQSQPSPAAADSPAPTRKQDSNREAAVKVRLAESLLQQGKSGEAVETLKEAIHLQPDFVDAHFALGVALARQGRERHGAAVDHFLTVLRLAPEHLDARINLSNLLEQEGEFEAAAVGLQEALSLANTRADLYVMLGQKQERADKYPEAVQSFRRALELDPTIPGAHYGMGMALRREAHAAGACAEFRLELKQNPKDALTHYQLGWLLILQNEPKDAAAHLEEAVRLKPDLAAAYSKLGVLYRSLKRDDDAEGAFRNAIRLNPKLEKACYGLAMLLQAKGKASEAQDLFEQVRQLKQASGTSIEASNLNATGLALMNSGNLDSALEKFRAALKLDPASAPANYNEALALARQGKAREAAESFRKAIQLRPGFVLAHYGLGLVLRLAGDPSADEQLRKAELMKKLVPQTGTTSSVTDRSEDAE